MQNLTELRSVYAEELVPGARNAVRTCLKIEPQERVALVTDLETEEIAAALADQVRQVGAHMVSISHRIMCEAMRADFNEVDAISRRVHARASKAKKIVARSRAGSQIEATFDPEIKWLKTSGIISTSKWGNLPGGEVLTSPARVDGVDVADGVVGDYLCARYGDLERTPLAVTIENSRIVNIRCDNRELAEDFAAYTSTDENSNRVGEFAIGTNIAIENVIGNILQDEKIPTLHLAFGHPYSEHTGAKWSSTTHIDIVGRRFDIWFDDEQVMADSKFLI